MTVQASITLGTSRTLLSPSATHSGVDITIQNDSGNDVFIGSSAVTTSNYGFKLPNGTAISFALRGADELYGVAASSSTVNVLTLGL